MGDVMEKMKLTFFAQRQLILQDPPITDIVEKWPFLFIMCGMEIHFQNLVGLPLRYTMQEGMNAKAGTLMDYAR